MSYYNSSGAELKAANGLDDFLGIGSFTKNLFSGSDPLANIKKEAVNLTNSITEAAIEKSLPVIKSSCKEGTRMAIQNYGWEVWAMGLTFIGGTVGLGYYLGQRK